MHVYLSSLNEFHFCASHSFNYFWKDWKKRGNLCSVVSSVYTVSIEHLAFNIHRQSQDPIYRRMKALHLYISGMVTREHVKCSLIVKNSFYQSRKKLKEKNHQSIEKEHKNGSCTKK